MSKKLIAVVIVALSLGVGAGAYAQVGRSTQDPPAEELPPPPTVTEDWCMFMADAFGPATGASDLASAIGAAIQSNTVSPQVAYVALLEGIPAELEPDYAVVRTASQQLLDGQAVPNSPEVLAAATTVDGFMATNCI